MSKTIYIGNLPWSTTEAELSQLVSAHAPVHGCRIIQDRDTGRSRGFGFVEVNDEDADRVVQALNGTQVGGRTLTVNEAQPRQPRY